MATNGPPLGRLAPSETVMLMCDLQEKFQGAVFGEDVVAMAELLLKTADLFGLPVIATEQYPKGLGHTLPRLKSDKLLPFEKTKFSMCTDEVVHALKSTGRTQVVLFGVETHVCIKQTALDLLQLGYWVHVVEDCTSSRFSRDHRNAIDRLARCGCFIETTESLVFELLGDKKCCHFKELSKMVTARKKP